MSPEALPDGRVLVVGSGQTGCQLAEELREAGRDTYLACGRAPWMPRRLGDRDMLAWVVETPVMEATVADLPSPMARLTANLQTSGSRGGHDLHYRTLQALGVKFLGHFIGCEDGVIPGLHFMGVHFQRKRKSAIFLGVAEDAAALAERMLSQKRSKERPMQ